MKSCPTCSLRYPDQVTFCFVEGQTLAPLADPFVGVTLDGRFRVEEKVADGAWAQTYRASHRLIERGCMVKLISEPLNDAHLQRFAAALKLARRCSHENIAEVSDGGTTSDGTSYIVQPLTDGVTLTETLRRGPFDVPRALGVASQLLAALGRIHDFGVVHGDLHPANVLLSGGDVVQLIDVGLGRTLFRDPWEDDARVLANQSFLAPERAGGVPASATSDIYSVGALIYHMMTGRLPVEADDVTELRAQLATDPPALSDALPQLAEPLCTWLGSLLSRSPELRFDNAHQVLLDMRSRAAQCEVAITSPHTPSAQSRTIALDADFSRWPHFRVLFEQMVGVGFPTGAPSATNDALSALQGRVLQLDEIGKNALYQYGLLEDLNHRGREARRKIAQQMDTLNENSAQLRIDLHPLRVAASRHADKVAVFPAKMHELHREVISWEGRSGFAEPYPQLAAAYRAVADLLDKWHGVRQAEINCLEEARDREGELGDVTSELSQLRESLRVHESNLEGERTACVTALADLGREADRLNGELLDLAARFSAPLRSKPELGSCFRQLQQAQ
jgi:serine/threonine-protein kinase